MKKNYKNPETVVLEMELTYCVLENSGVIGSGGAMTNENDMFDDGDLPTESKSNLWEN